LEKLGFNKTWIHWVSSFYGLVFSRVKINEFLDSIRQGCPLAPYLFILATNILRYKMENPRYAIQGLILPSDKMFRFQSFVDDITLYWHGTMLNSNREKISFPFFVNPLVPK
jgi:hypothetical protein